MKTWKHFVVVGILAIIALAFTACPPEPTPTHVHQWSAWTETTTPNCTTEGVETRTCTIDQTHKETKAIDINPNAHNWQPASTATAPTCTVDGNGDQICTYNATHTQNGTIPKLGHDYQNYSQTTAPTCTEAGIETGTCTHDTTHKDTRPIAIDPTAHDWNTIYTTLTAPTEKTDGAEVRTCKHNSAHTDPRSLYATGTTGLSFELIDNDTAYRVKKGTVTSGEVHIPSYWRGNSTNYDDYKPVTEIGSTQEEWDSGAFWRTSITTIHIPSSI